MAAVNPYWQQAAWFLDPANATGLASDGNTGLDATHPLLTWGEIVARWGTTQPHLRQSTTFTWMSSQAANSDPVVFAPYVENQSVVSMVGQLGATQQIATGVLSNVTAKNRATPQLLLSQSGATAAGQFIVNTTHASRAWTYAVSSGSIFDTSQPLVSPATPVTNPSPAEVDTWANGDAVTVYAPATINLAFVSPIVANFNGAANNLVVFQNLSIAAGTSGFDSIALRSSAVYFVECQFLGTLDLVLDATAIAAGFINCDFGSITRLWSNVGQQGLSVVGGQCRSTTLQLSGTLSVTGDFICKGGFFFSAGNGTFGLIYIDTGRTLTFLGPGTWQQNTVYGAPIVWGPGTLNVGGTVRFQYPAGAGKAVSTFLQTGGLQLNSLTNAWNAVSSAAPTANKTLSPANLDSDGGAATCCYMVPGGGAITNTTNAS